jgi:hypothetical protein
MVTDGNERGDEMSLSSPASGVLVRAAGRDAVAEWVSALAPPLPSSQLVFIGHVMASETTNPSFAHG